MSLSDTSSLTRIPVAYNNSSIALSRYPSGDELEAAAAKRREERKLQHTLEEEELRKDRQLRDLQIEQLLDEKAEKEKIAAKKKITRKSP